MESAVELGGGLYNSVYRIRLRATAEPVVLRVAPPAERQFTSEAHLMRNECASVPWLAPIADLMPRVLTADFTGSVIGRDWMLQSFLPGTPAPQKLGSFPKDTHGLFFRQLGEITAAVHAVVPSGRSPAPVTPAGVRPSSRHWARSPTTWRAAAWTRSTCAEPPMSRWRAPACSTRLASPGC
ncbi:phosphotransferase family protein [Streptomyces erythrochromogenes]|uniref:phosphotransferase family protein n=1 Tax=Streptomyces erythrochromogenes TaxID=285574 RepID=UPI0030B8CFD1